MPDIRTLNQVQQGSIHIIGVSSDAIRPTRVLVASVNYSADAYAGPYTVTPRFAEQTLSTNHKTMLHDVTVYEIPVTRTTNPQGGQTIVIG